MNKKYARFVRLLNRILYISSAAMLIAGAFLVAMPQTAEATCGDCGGMKLNLSHIDCAYNSVEVHFVLLNVPYGTTPGVLTFSVKINGGTEGSYTISAPTSHSGNTWHYYYYFSTNGKYDVTGGSVVVGSGTVSLHNPHDYKDENQNCVVPMVTYCKYKYGSYTMKTVPQTDLIYKYYGHCYKTEAGSNPYSIIPGFTTTDGCTFTAQGNQDYLLTGCATPVYGCTDPAATNYNSAANIDDGSCTYPPTPVPGCTDPTATNYNPAATVDDGSCTYPPTPVPGCTDEAATNYNPDATVDDGSCEYPPEEIPGCTDDEATNYNPEATVDDGSCEYPPEPVYGCTDDAATNYNPEATIDDGSCEYPPESVYGCTDDAATNYNPEATIDDGSCEYPPEPVYGCTDEAATNYNSEATVDDGSCEYPPEEVPGCMDEKATNYNSEATVDDGSCTYEPGPLSGCTDPTATNYNAEATVDDGSCTYKKTVVEPKELSVEIDPFCTYDGLMQWTIINPYSTNIYLNRYTVDGVSHDGFWVAPGEHDLVVTDLGTHTVVVYFGEAGATDSLTHTIDVCPLQIPVTGGDVLIPVTGADETDKLGMGFGLGGMSLVGMAMLVSALRKIYHL